MGKLLVSRKKKPEEHKAKIVTKQLGEVPNIKRKDAENAVKGIIEFTSKNPHLQNQLLNEEMPLFLQINSFKIPNLKGKVKQIFRVPMEHSILPSNPDICLIVPDVKGIKTKEHEKHLEHYEHFLKSKDVENIKKIMTFHEFKTEYDTFELKGRLADLYDLFLVDGRISGKVVHKCGSIFYKKRKVPLSIKLCIPNLKQHIEKACKKAYFHLSLKSDSHSLQFGHTNMNVSHLIDNILNAVKFLSKDFPGKMDNIRSINVFAHRGCSIPIYLSIKNSNDIKIPTLASKKPKAYKSCIGELTTQYNADVVVRPSGQVIVRRKKAPTNKTDEMDITEDTSGVMEKEKTKVKKSGTGNQNKHKKNAVKNKK